MKRIRGEYLPLLFFYSILSLVVTYPLISRLSSEIPGKVFQIDQTSRLWQIWWANFAVRHHLPLFHTDYMYYPFGIDLLAYFGSYFDLLLFIPLTSIITSPPLINNLLLLAGGIVFPGISGYILTKYITGNRLAALLGGTVASVNPYTYRHALLTHTEQIETGFLFLAIFFFLRSLRGPFELRRVFLTSIFTFFTYLSYMAYAIFFFIHAALFSLLLPFTGGGAWRVPLLESLKRLFATLLLSLVLLAPLLIIFSRSYFTFGYSKDFLFPERIDYRTLSLVQKEPEDPLFGFRGDEDFDLRVFQSSLSLSNFLRPENIVVLIVLLFPLPFAFRRGERGGPGIAPATLITAIAFLAFSFGPYLKLGDSIESVVHIPLPYNLLHQFLPFFSRFNHPERFQVLFYPPLAILACTGLATILNGARWKGRMLLPIALIIIYVAIFKTLFPPYSTIRPFECPDLYIEMRDEADVKVISLPFDFSRTEIFVYPYYYQICHEKRILGGIPHLYNLRDEYRDFFHSSTFLSTLLEICNGTFYEKGGGREELMEDIEALRSKGFRYVVLHLSGGAAGMHDTMEAFLTGLLGPPVRKIQGTIIAWKL